MPHSKVVAPLIQIFTALGIPRESDNAQVGIRFQSLAISLLWLIYPGWAANIGPQSWLWPERVARRTLGEASLWDAGIRLMRAGNPGGWQAIVDAADLARENRASISGCQRAAAKAKEPVSCTVRVRMSQP